MHTHTHMQQRKCGCYDRGSRILTLLKGKLNTVNTRLFGSGNYKVDLYIPKTTPYISICTRIKNNNMVIYIVLLSEFSQLGEIADTNVDVGNLVTNGSATVTYFPFIIKFSTTMIMIETN